MVQNLETSNLGKTLAAPIVPEGGNDREGSEPRQGWGQKLWALIQGASNQGLPGKEGIVRVNSRVSSYLTFQSPASAPTGWTCMEAGRHRSSLILFIRVSLPRQGQVEEAGMWTRRGNSRCSAETDGMGQTGHLATSKVNLISQNNCININSNTW